jgi:hypothetical protein
MAAFLLLVSLDLYPINNLELHDLENLYLQVVQSKRTRVIFGKKVIPKFESQLNSLDYTQLSTKVLFYLLQSCTDPTMRKSLLDSILSTSEDAVTLLNILTTFSADFSPSSLTTLFLSTKPPALLHAVLLRYLCSLPSPPLPLLSQTLSALLAHHASSSSVHAYLSLISKLVSLLLEL